MNLQSRIGGYNPSKRPDDAKVHEIGRFQAKELPPKVDLRKHMSEVEAQVGNSCVANAFVGAYEYLAKRDLGEAGDVSRLFVYYNARAIGDKAGEDRGTQMNYAIKALMEHGACSEEYWPNDEELILQEPETVAYEHAANYKITEAEFIKTDLNLWRHTLAEGYPIAFALNTFQSFDDATKNKGRVAMPKQSDNVRETHGWHAMLCVGYSDKDKMFIVRNSWGTAWGDKGYCYIPYDYVMHPDYNGDDSWIIKSVSDLDFSAEVWEEDESFFEEDGSILLYDFYVRTENPDGFIEALTALCESHAESEEDYYFDYDYEESEDEGTTVSVMNFDLTIEESEAFLEELDALCLKYAIDEDYDFNTEGELGEEEGEDEEEDEEDEEEEEEEESEDEDEDEDEDEEEEDEDEEEEDEDEEEEDEDEEEEDEDEEEEEDEDEEESEDEEEE